jgi:hypothetical protein
MRQKTLLHTLSVGRCFTLDVPPGGSEEPSSKVAVKQTTPILPPAAAWKVVGEEKGEVLAESAAGEKKAFARDTKVVEVPRQGYDSLVARRGKP